MHQIAEICRYDLSEAERQPILQAEALKEKDKTIASLRNEIASLRGESGKSDHEDHATTSQKKMRLPPCSPKKPWYQAHPGRRGQNRQADDQDRLEESEMTSIADDLTHLSFERHPANLPPKWGDIFGFQMTTSHPFPTLWSAKDDTSTLLRLLPPEPDLFFYLEAFERRSQSFSFPHVPEQATVPEVQRFLANMERNAALYPDMLALLFAILALGLQDGAYDKSGEKWTAGHVEAESKKGDVYMHRDPSQVTTTPIPPKEAAARRSLWWWMLHMDQQYSMTLGRPLAISSMGDCPSPEPAILDPVHQSVSDYITQFSLLGRQILSVPYLGNDRIDKYTDNLLRLRRSLPPSMQFDSNWLNRDTAVVGWPLNAQAALLYAKAHNFLISLNRRRVEVIRRNSEGSRMSMLALPAVTDVTGVVRGRPRVLESCRALLHAFEFFRTRLRAGMISWTMGQMAFNASMLLTLSMLETGETQDLLPVQHAYSTFLEMNKLGIHKLAGAAVERLGRLMKEFRTEDSAKETVMGQQGMLLLEDPGSHCSVPESNSAYRTTTSYSPGNPKANGGQTVQRVKTVPTQRKRGPRRTATTRDGGVSKSRQDSVNKGPRSAVNRRFSDSMTPRPGQRRRTNRSPPSLSLATSIPDQSIFTTTSTPAVKSETLFTPSIATFDSQPSTAFASPSQPPQELHQVPGDISCTHNQDYVTHQNQQQYRVQQHHQQYQLYLHAQQQPPPPRPDQHSHQQQQQQNGLASHLQMNGSRANDNGFDFSNASTPYSTEFFESTVPSAVGHGFDDHLVQFDPPPFSAPPFSMPADQPFAVAHF
ncbi:MAG: hypothetical protein Q9163_006382 [Psora crenata]